MIDTGPATPEELEFVRRLQHFYCDCVVDGRPTGDWHIESTPQKAVLLLRQHIGESIRKFVTAGPGLTLRCAFCGEKYADGTPDHKHASLEAHIRVCKIHPIGIENREMRAALESAKEQMQDAGLWNGLVAAACRKKP